MSIESDNILKQRGGTLQNDLTHKINLEHFEISSKHKSKYYDTQGLSHFLLKHKNKLTVLSLNIASLNSKFDDLTALLDELEAQNTKIGVICIQEAGIKDSTDVKHLEIQNYNLFTQSLNKDCSTKGGLAIYVL